MKEIGGYFEFELKFHGREYHEAAVPLNLSRNAVCYLTETKQYRKLYIPYFLCDCIKNLLKKIHIEIDFYHITETGRPIFSKELQEDEAIWIVNYYGQLAEEEILHYKELWGNIILDNTHDFFTRPLSGIDTVYNARKYFGVADGGYLYTDIRLDRTLETAYSYHRIGYMVGRYEKTADAFYSEFAHREKELNDEGLKEMSPFSRNILRGVDYSWVRQVRESNFSYLSKRLGQYNLWPLQERPGTYMYPFRCQNAPALRQKLIAQKIYIPVLWPNVLEDLPSDSLEYHMANDILPLPIDQRYDEKDMKYLCDTLLEINS